MKDRFESQTPAPQAAEIEGMLSLFPLDPSAIRALLDTSRFPASESVTVQA
ncbi:MAG: hypothetical protein AAGD04_05945 [Pseudomonadota bacterium]